MSLFNLPDLGEGLPDAEISEWHVKVGDIVKTDQPLVSMETAKAVVEVPSPQDGVISKLFGKKGDIIDTGNPLVEFDKKSAKKTDAGTVVGNIQTSGEDLEADFLIEGAKRKNTHRASREAVAYARTHAIDLSTIKGSGAQGLITLKDVEKIRFPLKPGFEQIKGVRRTMVRSMSESHQHVVPVTIFDDADIDAWAPKTDITARLIKAIVDAVNIEPSVNAHYDGYNVARNVSKAIHLGLAMDTDDGLFVPVIRHAEKLSPQQIREEIIRFKQEVTSRDIAPKELTGATITLSNFGKFAGRYASPIITPPAVAILAVGRLRTEPVMVDGEVQAHKTIPLSLSFDHRAVTGGEATRFMGAVIDSLASV